MKLDTIMTFTADTMAERVLDRTHRWPIKVYLAGRYEDQARLRQYALDLEREQGWKIVSSWLWSPDTRESARTHKREYAAARACLADIDQCDLFLLDLGDVTQTGGREFEAGYAYAKGKVVVRMGPERNIFHTLLPETLDGQDA